MTKSLLFLASGLSLFGLATGGFLGLSIGFAISLIVAGIAHGIKAANEYHGF